MRGTTGSRSTRRARSCDAPVKILGLECAVSACSAAVWADGSARARRFEANAEGRADVLVVMAEAVMAEAGLAYAGLDAVVATVGPGRFTGVRVALAAARGLALAAGVPAWGVTTTDAVAHAARALLRAEETLIVALDCKRHELASEIYARGAAGPALRAPDDLAAAAPTGPLALAGDGAPRLFDALGRMGRAARLLAQHPQPDAADVAALAAVRLAEGAALLVPRPLYLRTPDVTVAGA